MDARISDLPLQAEDHYSYDPVQGASSRPAIGLVDIFDILRRGWRVPLYGSLICFVLAGGYVLLASVPYKSSARILIDRSINRYLQSNKIVDQPTFDEPEIASQVYVLSSDSVIVPVVQSLKLTEDSEFVGNRSGGGRSDATADPGSSLERIAVEGVLKHLTVNREDVANVITVSFESKNPIKAASIANALADTYISTILEAGLKSTRIVSQWLQDRLTELRAQVTEADRALEEFKAANNLLMEGKSSQSNELLGNLRSQLASARLATAEAKARLDLIQRTSGESVLTTVSVDAMLQGTRSGTINFALNNTDLVKLRGQYRDAKARETDLEARVGPKHAALVKLRQQIDGIRAAIHTEEQRIADVYTNEYHVAKARETELAANVQKLSGQTEGSSQTQVTMRELENSAETLRNLYNTFLQKFKEVQTNQSEALPLQNARIITRAVTPLYRSSKKPLAIVAGSTIFGLLLGCGFILAREWVADVFRTTKAVERVSDAKCVVLPKVEPRSSPIEEFVLDAPYSRFAETLRNVKASIDTALIDYRGKVIGIVSAAPEEGKTIVATNLATLIAASTGARTLLIDSDLHLRKLSAALAPNAHAGFLDALEYPSRLSRCVVKRGRSGLHVLPCASANRIPNAAELLGSPEMEHLLAVARRSYDYVVVEIAPIMSVVDLKKIERFIDAFVFVVEWGETKQSLVADALSEAPMIRDRLVGMVLNKADPAALQQIEAFNGSKLQHYYQD